MPKAYNNSLGSLIPIPRNILLAPPGASTSPITDSPSLTTIYSLTILKDNLANKGTKISIKNSNLHGLRTKIIESTRMELIAAYKISYIINLSYISKTDLILQAQLR